MNTTAFREHPDVRAFPASASSVIFTDDSTTLFRADPKHILTRVIVIDHPINRRLQRIRIILLETIRRFTIRHFLRAAPDIIENIDDSPTVRREVRQHQNDNHAQDKTNNQFHD